MTTDSGGGAGSGISATVMTTGSPVLRAVGAARVRQLGYRCADGVVRQLDVVRLPRSSCIGGGEERGLFLGAVEVARGGRLPLSIWVWWPRGAMDLLDLLVILNGIGGWPVERQLPERRFRGAACECDACRWSRSTGGAYGLR